MVMSDWDSMKASREDSTVPASGDVQKAAAAQCDLVPVGSWQLTNLVGRKEAT